MPSPPAAPRLPQPVLPAGWPVAHPGATVPAGWMTRAVAAASPEAERLPLWAPVALGLGILVYFALAAEPTPGLLSAAAIAAGLAMPIGTLARVPVAPRLVLAALALCLGGAALAQLRSDSVAAPVLAKRWGPAELRGRVVAVEIRPDGRRLVLDRLEMPGLHR
ncbi:MAG: hypothetical protein ACKOUS_19145, partial [Alphaproteobacteria bacterium]